MHIKLKSSNKSYLQIQPNGNFLFSFVHYTLRNCTSWTKSGVALRCAHTNPPFRCLKQVSNSLKGTPEYLPKQEPVWDTKWRNPSKIKDIKYGKKGGDKTLVTFETWEKNLLAMGKNAEQPIFSGHHPHIFLALSKYIVLIFFRYC